MSIVQTYFLYYSIIIFTSMILSFYERLNKFETRKTSKVLFWLAIIFPAVISSFRYGIGVDYFNYERIYYILGNYNLVDAIINTRYEPGWILLNYIVKVLFDDVMYVFIISSFLICLFYFKSIYDNRRWVNVGIAVFILLCTMYNPSFNVIRLYLAASILMLSVKPIVEKKPLKFLSLVLIAGSFHYTSLIFLPVYWLVNSRSENLSLIKKTIATSSAILLILLAEPILSLITNIEMFSSYSNYQIEFNNFGVGGILIRVPIIAIILINSRNLKSNNNVMHNFIILYFISIILNMLGYLQEYAGRVAVYFEMMEIFILSAIIKQQKNKYEKIFYTIIIIVYFLGMYTFEIIINNGHQTIPYIWMP